LVVLDVHPVRPTLVEPHWEAWRVRSFGDIDKGAVGANVVVQQPALREVVYSLEDGAEVGHEAKLADVEWRGEERAIVGDEQVTTWRIACRVSGRRSRVSPVSKSCSAMTSPPPRSM
jgi:hypothetical protein